MTGGAIDDALKELNALANEFEKYPDEVAKSLANAVQKSSAAIREGLGAFVDDKPDEDEDEEDDKLTGDALKAMTTRYDRLVESLRTEEEAIEESYKSRREFLLEYEKQTGEDQTALMKRLEKERDQQRKALQMKQWDTALSSFDDFQNNMAVLARTGNKELAAVYKAAAIANTTIKTYESATSAYAALAGIPIVGPALGTAAAAAAVAAGMANIHAITSQQVGGYAQGGIIPGNSHNGDNLTASVNSGEMILNYSQQKNLLDMATKGGSGSGVIVNVQNFGGGEVEIEEATNIRDERVINIAVGRAKREAKDEIASDIDTGAGQVSRRLSPLTMSDGGLHNNGNISQLPSNQLPAPTASFNIEKAPVMSSKFASGRIQNRDAFGNGRGSAKITLELTSLQFGLFSAW